MRKLWESINLFIISFTRGKKWKIILTVFSAFLLPFSVPNDIIKFGNPLLGLICVVPLYVGISGNESIGFKRLLGVIFGVLSTLVMYYWLQFFGEYSIYTLGGVMLGYALFNSFLFPGLSILMQLFPRQRAIVFACGWTLYEYLKSSGFSAFPWGLLAHPFHDVAPLIQFIDITGVWGLSFLIALVNGILGELLSEYAPSHYLYRGPKRLPARMYRAQVALTAIIVCFVFIYGGIRLAIPVPIEQKFKTVLIQQNRDPWAEGNYAQSLIDGIDLSEQGAAKLGEKPDLIVWNETSFQHPIPDALPLLEKFPPKKPFLPALRKLGTYFLVGAPYIVNRTEYDAMNAAVLLSPKGDFLGYYGKMQPVPFVESNPFWGIPFMRDFFKKVVGLSGVWVTGTEYKVFSMELPGQKPLLFGTPICFEDAFPDLCRRFIASGASLLINLTNVSWSKTESAELQMFVASKFRSVETKRTLLRSTNSGVTCVIGAYGQILYTLPLFQTGFLSIEVPVYKEKSLTPYTIYGDWFPLVLGILMSGFLIFNLFVCYFSRKKLVFDLYNF
jgi:apolipoprotein N-acyltransferase